MFKATVHAVTFTDLLLSCNKKSKCKEGEFMKHIENLAADFVVEFDRVIDRNKHFVSPGTIAMKFDDGVEMNFDFEKNSGWDDGKCVSFEEYKLDTATFPESKQLVEYISSHKVIALNMFIYTGEDYEECPVAVALHNFELYSTEDDCDFSFTASEELLMKADLNY